VTEKIPLPENCGECSYFRRDTARCRRHAPTPGAEEYELPFWPKVRPGDRCGMGAALAALENPVACGRCIHWWQPGDRPLAPPYRQGQPAEWWQRTGLCTRFAPSPSTDDYRRTFWKVTHAADGCGDGETPKVQD